MSNQAGKGDKPRPTNKVVYNNNYDGIVWKEEQPPKKAFKEIKGKRVYKY
jgi:hypothetical protein